MSFKEKIGNLFGSGDQSKNVAYGEDLTTNKEEYFRIAICQDGKFVATFDVGK
jgi:hypothetical protein